MLKDLLIVIATFLLTMSLFRWLSLPPASGVAVVVICLMVATWRLRLRGETWRELGLGWPTASVGLFASALGWMLLAYVAAGAMTVLVTRGLGLEGADFARYGALQGNLPRFVWTLGIAWTSAAVGEELLFRGFLQSRLQKAFGGGGWAGPAAVLVQATSFGLVHAFQGLSGALAAGMVGFVFGVAYLRKRSLWPLTLAHGLIDTIGLTALYLGKVPGG